MSTPRELAEPSSHWAPHGEGKTWYTHKSATMWKGVAVSGIPYELNKKMQEAFREMEDEIMRLEEIVATVDEWSMQEYGLSYQEVYRRRKECIEHPERTIRHEDVMRTLREELGPDEKRGLAENFDATAILEP